MKPTWRLKDLSAALAGVEAFLAALNTC
jgi:hypothetical protein